MVSTTTKGRIIANVVIVYRFIVFIVFYRRFIVFTNLMSFKMVHNER